jgi:hypothetical protein
MLGVAAYYGARRRRYPAVLLFVVVLLQVMVGGGLIAVAISRERWLGTAVAYLLLVGTTALFLQNIVYGLLLLARQVPIDKAAKEKAAKGEVAQEDDSEWTILGHSIKAPPQWDIMLFSISFFWIALLLFWAPYHGKVFYTGVTKLFTFAFKWKTIQDNFDRISASVFIVGCLVAAAIYYARKRRWLVALGWLGALALGLFLLIVLWRGQWGSEF